MNEEVMSKLKELAEYIEYSCDQWLVVYPNDGPSDMAFQRMMNFRTDIHEILEMLGVLDRYQIACRKLNRFKKYAPQYMYDKQKKALIQSNIKKLESAVGAMV